MNFLARFENISLQTVVYKNTIKEYLIAAGILLVTFIAAIIITRVLRTSLNKIAEKTENTVISESLKGIMRLEPVIKFVPIYITMHYLTLPLLIQTIVEKMWVLVLTWCFIRYVIWVVQIFSRQYVEKNNFSPMIQHNINLFATVLLYMMGLLFLLSNMGFNINTLIAGFGIGGMAIALASQTLLADLFNYFTILLDKPFTVGDLVRAGSYIGHVERIGLKGTRIRALGGEQVIVSNTDMTKNTVQNFHTMEKRRNKIIVSVRYDTPKAKVAIIPGLLHDIIENTEDTQCVRSYFASFESGTFNFELVYYVLSKEYIVFVQKTQEINMKIVAAFEDNDIKLAYPSQSLYLEQTPRTTD